MSQVTENKFLCRVEGEGYAEIENPPWRVVENTLWRLDGGRFSECIFYPDKRNEELFMAAGGGDEARLVVFFRPPTGREEDVFILSDGTENNELVTQVYAGQPTEYPKRLCVDVPVAIQAFRHFYETGAIDRSLKWERDVRQW